MSSPTQRSLKELNSTGWMAGIVERWIQQARKRIDLFGCIDIVAIRPGRTLGVQTTSSSNHSSHVIKALALPGIRMWLEAGNEFSIWSWGKKGKQGTRKKWMCRKQPITLKDFYNATGRQRRPIREAEEATGDGAGDGDVGREHAGDVEEDV